MNNEKQQENLYERDRSNHQGVVDSLSKVDLQVRRGGAQQEHNMATRTGDRAIHVCVVTLRGILVRLSFLLSQ